MFQAADTRNLTVLFWDPVPGWDGNPSESTGNRLDEVGEHQAFKPTREDAQSPETAPRSDLSRARSSVEETH